jgi:uncharacterized protein (TIGR02266 family)
MELQLSPPSLKDRVKGIFGKKDDAPQREEFNVNKPETVTATRKEPSPAGGPNDRQHARHEVNLEVSLASEHNFYNGFSENISEGGIFIATHDPLPMGEVVQLSFKLPSGHEVNVHGEVRWIRDAHVMGDATPGMGLKFNDLSEEDRVAIENFLERREPLFHDEEL